MSAGMRIFDFHTHAFPDKIAQKTLDSISSGAGVPYWHDGTFDGLAAYERAGRSSGYLLLPIATKPSQVRAVNEWAASKTGGSVAAFGSVHPGCEDFAGEVERIVALGLKGVKLHPEYQDFFADDERVFPLYEAVFAKGLPLCFHAGADPGFKPPWKAAARRIGRVCAAFPHGRVIAAHMGGLYDLNDLHEVFGCLAGRNNLWMDTSFVSAAMDPADIRRLARMHGADRFLFGTDAPWFSFEASVRAMLSAGLTDAETEAIFYGNAARLLVLHEA